MKKFDISSDSTCDLPAPFLKERGIRMVCLQYIMEKDGELQPRVDGFEREEQFASFYNELRDGGFSRTSMLTLEAHRDYFAALAKEGMKEVVHFSLSSGLSPTAIVAAQAAEEVSREFPSFRVRVVDSLSATVGQGLLCRMAADLRDEGATAEETVRQVVAARDRLQHWVMASNLFYLRRGGRVSGASAVVGTMLNIKPMLVFNREGKLAVTDKCKGMKKVYAYMLDRLKEYPMGERPYLTVVHADAPERAAELAAALREKTGAEPFVQQVGPVIGSHLGPDAVAYVYVSRSLRPDKPV